MSQARLQEQMELLEHPYAFAENNPVNRIDPSGLWSLYRWIYTGDPNASDAVYNAALDAAAKALVTDSITNAKCIKDCAITQNKSLLLPSAALGTGIPGIPKAWISKLPESLKEVFGIRAIRLANSQDAASGARVLRNAIIQLLKEDGVPMAKATRFADVISPKLLITQLKAARGNPGALAKAAGKGAARAAVVTESLIAIYCASQCYNAYKKCKK
jgi:hypothetical protein